VPDNTANVVICGAGIAGIAAAYFLAARQGIADVVLVDERPPLTLTSDKSTEAYRNWWPGPDDAMIRLMDRSIDLLEALADGSGNRFLLNRRGYVYATADPAHVGVLRASAERASAQGAGPLRVHTGQPDDPPYVPAPAEGYADQPTGADLLLDPALIRKRFPYLSEEVVAVLHARRCGWFSGQQLGMLMLEQARQRGIRFVSARVGAVDVRGGRVSGVRLSGGESLAAPIFINAAGPMLREVGAMLGINLPVFSERHLKVSFKDHLGAIPRDAPLLIWEDSQMLGWSDEEREMLAESDETAWLLDPFPPGVHARPEGGSDSQNVLLLWPYHTPPVAETFPLPNEPFYPEVALRGIAAMIPGLRAYFEHMPRPFIDGGYYTKTRENRPLIGPLPVEGAYVIGALSGFGLMASAAAGELLAAHVAGVGLPDYAPAFALARYEDAQYRALVEEWGSTGQL
jgi:glycine/D-amino acid oxidase-like deaminating enzyme